MSKHVAVAIVHMRLFYVFLHKEDLIFLKPQFSENYGENWSPFFSSQKTLVLFLLSLTMSLASLSPSFLILYLMFLIHYYFFITL